MLLSEFLFLCNEKASAYYILYCVHKWHMVTGGYGYDIWQQLNMVYFMHKLYMVHMVPCTEYTNDIWQVHTSQDKSKPLHRPQSLTDGQKVG